MVSRVERHGICVKSDRGGQKQGRSVVQKAVYYGVSVVEVILGVLAELWFSSVDEVAGWP